MWLLEDTPLLVSQVEVPTGGEMLLVEQRATFTAGSYRLVARVVDAAGAQAETAVSMVVRPKTEEGVGAQIVEPADKNLWLTTEDLLMLEAEAAAGATVQWHSNVLGLLGSGARLTTVLSEGTHRISLVVNGSEVDDLTVTVTAPVRLTSLVASVYEVGADVRGMIHRFDGEETYEEPISGPFDLYEGDWFTITRGTVTVYPVDGDPVRVPWTVGVWQPPALRSDN